MFPLGEAPTMERIQAADGADMTIMVVEAAETVPWIKPQDLPFGPETAFPRLSSYGRYSPILFADGSVRVFDYKVDSNTLRALITWNGNEQVELDE